MLLTSRLSSGACSHIGAAANSSWSARSKAVSADSWDDCCLDCAAAGLPLAREPCAPLPAQRQLAPACTGILRACRSMLCRVVQASSRHVGCRHTFQCSSWLRCLGLLNVAAPEPDTINVTSA